MVTVNEAEMYDLFGYPQTTDRDCHFLEDSFSVFGRDVKAILDLACGTGRHALEMAKRGYSVTGIDVSESMINVARKRAVEEGLRIEFTINDIRDLRFIERFDAAYCLFNTLFTFTRNDDLINVMKGVNCSLKADGLFIVEVGNLWPLIAQGQFHNSTSKRVDEKAGWKRFRGDRTVIGPYNNIYYTESLTNYSREGVESKPEKATIGKRVVSVNEFDLLCRLTRFKIVGLYGSTDISKPIDNPDEIREIKEPYTSFVLVLTKC